MVVGIENRMWAVGLAGMFKSGIEDRKGMMIKPKFYLK
jgi:hypothetical protein